MPELPDITIYIDALKTRIQGTALTGLRLKCPFLQRTVQPKPQEAVGLMVTDLKRIGKRFATGFDNDIWFVLDLMIARRLNWKDSGTKIGAKTALEALESEGSSLVLKEADGIKRATLTATNHTVKQALTELEKMIFKAH